MWVKKETDKAFWIASPSSRALWTSPPNPVRYGGGNFVCGVDYQGYIGLLDWDDDGNFSHSNGFRPVVSIPKTSL